MLGDYVLKAEHLLWIDNLVNIQHDLHFFLDLRHAAAIFCRPIISRTCNAVLLWHGINFIRPLLFLLLTAELFVLRPGNAFAPPGP